MIAITDSSEHFIDLALIGPADCAADLLGSDERLRASARTRELYAPADDDWAHRIREILARADSILAMRPFEWVLGGE